MHKEIYILHITKYKRKHTIFTTISGRETLFLVSHYQQRGDSHFSHYVPTNAKTHREIPFLRKVKKPKIKEALEAIEVEDDVENSDLYMWAVSTNCYAQWAEQFLKTFK